jgi:hypothetical protein
MKRFIAALSLSVASTAVLAQNGKPFEQLDIDRALPNVPERVESMPDVVADEPTRLAAAPSETRSDAEIAVDETTGVEEQAAESPFANDWNFVAPAA